MPITFHTNNADGELVSKDFDINNIDAGFTWADKEAERKSMYVAYWNDKKGNPVRRVIKAASYEEADKWAEKQAVELGVIVIVAGEVK